MAGEWVTDVGEADFQTAVLDRSREVPVVVDFWAPWCGPCRQLTPVIDRIADQFAGKAKVGKVNVDENQELAVKYDVATIPRVMIFKGSDKPVFQHVGTISDADLAKVINSHL